MLKLSKYEFRKNRNFLLVIGIIFALLEIYFLAGIFMKNPENSAKALAFLFICAVVCFFSVFILAISNYSKELNSKSSYLIFMTPNTSLNIIFSKMFTILIIGLVSMTIICITGYIDWKLLCQTFPNVELAADTVQSLFILSGTNSGSIILGIITYVIEFIISFFSTVTLAYFSITLSATLFQNNRFKGLLSFALFLGFTYLLGLVSSLLPQIMETQESIADVLISAIPATILDVIVMCLCILGCSTLLDKKVSL